MEAMEAFPWKLPLTSTEVNLLLPISWKFGNFHGSISSTDFHGRFNGSKLTSVEVGENFHGNTSSGSPKALMNVLCKQLEACDARGIW